MHAVDRNEAVGLAATRGRVAALRLETAARCCCFDVRCLDALTCTMRMFLYSFRYSTSLTTYFSLRTRRDAPASAISVSVERGKEGEDGGEEEGRLYYVNSNNQFNPTSGECGSGRGDGRRRDGRRRTGREDERQDSCQGCMYGCCCECSAVYSLVGCRRSKVA